ncbi:hypothetical protein PARHAE_02585 [Paracoccus haematequi]|uniref:Uncharacterized protein n=1 Tax=Paracoccus haematequi TaxID=2491866 RepID=A0A447IPB6_9RHOB|nr:hypothetical protein PARHAE_02585 [Paracoccus haematequi]
MLTILTVLTLGLAALAMPVRQPAKARARR